MQRSKYNSFTVSLSYTREISDSASFFTDSLFEGQLLSDIYFKIEPLEDYVEINIYRTDSNHSYQSLIEKHIITSTGYLHLPGIIPHIVEINGKSKVEIKAFRVS